MKISKKIISMIFGFGFISNFAFSASIKDNLDNLRPYSYQWSSIMPCNWDKDLNNVTVFGYYIPGDNGQESYQDTLSPIWIKSENFDSDKGIMKIDIGFSASILTKIEGKTLNQIEVDFKTTRRRCEDNPFGGFFGSGFFQ